VIRILWILGPSPNSPFSGLLYDIFAEKVTKRLLESRLLRVGDVAIAVAVAVADPGISSRLLQRVVCSGRAIP